MKVLAIMSDLFFSPKINDAAKKLGMTAMFVKDKAVALEQFKLKPAVVIFDLNCASAEPLDLIRSIQADPETAAIPTVGFISHVQTEMKQQAQDLGCDIVVARSVFAQNLPTILANIATAAQAHEVG